VKLATLEREVTVSGASMVQGTIKGGAKAFSVIVDNMYSNKPQSIVREIMSNMWDAHRAAGIPDKPGSIIFPSLFNQMFVVRDYGEGLSHEYMTTRYTVAFDSSKEDDNTQVGTWGVGRLSPLSYTDTYTASSYQNGTVRHYSIVRNAGGVGFVYLGENPTDEPDGFKVSFPIERQDIEAFRKAFEIVSLGFDVKPEVINPRNGDVLPDLPVSASGTGWKLLDSSKLNHNHPMRGRAMLRMGCVVYPLNNIPDVVLGYDEKMLLSSPLLLEADIGSVSTTTSREQLSFGKNEPTATTIKTLLSNFVSESAESIIKSVEQATSKWNAAQRLASVRGLPSGIDRFVKSKAVWNGQEVSAYFDLTPGKFQGNLTITAGSRNYGSKRFSTRRMSYSKTCHGGDEPFVCVVDVGHKVKDLRVDLRVDDFWCSSQGDKYSHVVLLKYDSTSPASVSELKVALDYYKDIDVHYVKSMPDPGSTKRTGKPVAIKSQDGNGWKDDTITPTEIEAGGYYVKLNNNYVHSPVGFSSNFASIVQSLKSIGVIGNNQKIWVVPKTLWSKFKSDDWKDVYDVASEWVTLNTPVIEKVLSSTPTARQDFVSLRIPKGVSKHIDAYHNLFSTTAKFGSGELTRQQLEELCGNKLKTQEFHNNSAVGIAWKNIENHHPLLSVVKEHLLTSKAVLDYLRSTQ